MTDQRPLSDVKLLSPKGLGAALALTTSIGLVWGAVEAVVGAVHAAPDPLTIAAFHPLAVLGAAVPLLLAWARVPARVALPRLGLVLVWVATAVPLAIGINVSFLTGVPMVSATNAGVVVGAGLAALVPTLLVRPLVRRAAAGLHASAGAAVGLATLIVVGLCVLRLVGVFAPTNPGPWPDNRGQLGHRPNVVLILLDTLRADHLSSYGHEHETTPVLDALKAARFRRTYAPAHWTAPSTASLLTGLHPVSHRTTGLGSVLSEDAVTLAELLADEGYVTGHITGNFVASEAFGFTQGADWAISEATLPQARLMPCSLGRVLARKLAPLTRAVHLNDWADRFFDSVDDRRFFLYLHYKDPHQPYVPPPPYDTLFDEKFGGRVIVDPAIRRHWPITERERENMVARYDGAIRYLDDALGRVFARLDAMGVRDETLIVITSDHGEEFQDHDGWLHGRTLYEETTRVPLLVSYPPLVADTVDVPETVSLLDVLPTILDVTGTDHPPGLQGRSLLPLLGGASDGDGSGGGISGAPRGFLLDGTKTERMAYVEGDWKLARRVMPDGEVRLALYDLKNDPAERINLAGKRKDVADRLLAALQAAIERYRAVELTSEQKQLDPAEAERLRALGYLGH